MIGTCKNVRFLENYAQSLFPKEWWYVSAFCYALQGYVSSLQEMARGHEKVVRYAIGIATTCLRLFWQKPRPRLRVAAYGDP